MSAPSQMAIVRSVPNGGSVCVPRDERRSRGVVRGVRGSESGRRIGAWVVGVTACRPKAPGLGSGSVTGKGSDMKMDLVVVLFVIGAIAWLRKGPGVGTARWRYGAVQGPVG
jgi:hypothetical protein